jgi:hypothetical protein
LCVVAYTGNTSTLKADGEFSGWGQPGLHSEFKASLGCIVRPCLEKEKKREKKRKKKATRYKNWLWGRREDVRKGVGGWVSWKYCVHIYANRKMRPVETILVMEWEGIKENNGGGEFSYYIL